MHTSCTCIPCALARANTGACQPCKCKRDTPTASNKKHFEWWCRSTPVYDGQFTKCSRSLFHNVSKLGLISRTWMGENINCLKWRLPVKLSCRPTPMHDWKRSSIALCPLCMYGTRLRRISVSKFGQNTNTVSYDRFWCNCRCQLTPMYTKKVKECHAGSKSFQGWG